MGQFFLRLFKDLSSNALLNLEKLLRQKNNRKFQKYLQGVPKLTLNRIAVTVLVYILVSHDFRVIRNFPPKKTTPFIFSYSNKKNYPVGRKNITEQIFLIT